MAKQKPAKDDLPSEMIGKILTPVTGNLTDPAKTSSPSSRF
jgi:hypothetical protein